MSPTLTKRAAITAINRAGALLIFPIKDKPEPASLWSVFYPSDKMVWEWTDDSDDRVAKLWHLRAELSISNEVIYTKWFQGRATVFSKEAFIAMLGTITSNSNILSGLTIESKKRLSFLEDDSPLGTKQIKNLFLDELGAFPKNLDGLVKPLWKRLLIVGYGEKDEGGFPSLAVGSTKALFEELWDASRRYADLTKRQDRLAQLLRGNAPFLKSIRKFEADMAGLID